MAIKKILTTLDGLNEGVAALYVQKPDGKFHLDLEDDDAEPLRRAKEHEVGLRQIAEQEREAARSDVAKLSTEVAKLKEDSGKDINTVRTQLADEYAERERKLKDDHTKEVGGLRDTVKKVFVEDVALRIATEITDVPDLLVPLLQNRIQMELVDGKPVTRVLSADGKASSMTPDELKQEYSQNPKFERIIRGSNASGGGASGGSGGGGAPKKLKDMGDAERMEWAKRDPQGFSRAVAAEKAATK